jgi:hypothetical protein
MFCFLFLFADHGLSTELNHALYEVKPSLCNDDDLKGVFCGTVLHMTRGRACTHVILPRTRPGLNALSRGLNGLAN